MSDYLQNIRGSNDPQAAPQAYVPRAILDSMQARELLEMFGPYIMGGANRGPWMGTGGGGYSLSGLRGKRGNTMPDMEGTSSSGTDRHNFTEYDALMLLGR